MPPLPFSRKAFTLIELLVVIGIVAFLSVLVILVLNPAELLRQSRDSIRVSDLSTLNNALNAYGYDQGGSPGFFLGISSTTYLSVPDATATSTAGDQCQGLALPSLPAGYNYYCGAPNSFRSATGTGWLPVNFASTTNALPMTSLPVDPVNQTSSNLYYSFQSSGTAYSVSAFPESQKYIKTVITTGGNDPILMQAGSGGGSSLLNLGRGLIAYWNLDEGSGAIATDLSGGANNGVWSGGMVGANGGYYSPGKVGLWAGAFDGSTTRVTVSSSSFLTLGSVGTICVWAYPNGGGANDERMVVGNNYVVQKLGAGIEFYSNPYAVVGGTFTIGAWNHVCVTVNNGTASIYVNGSWVASGPTNNPIGTGAATEYLGYDPNLLRYFGGLIDEVRIYSRVLSAAEIQEMYNAEK